MDIEKVQSFAVDKSTYGPGPWHDEPDRVDFQHAGFACLLLRGIHHGAWCGYVGVPSTHPDFRKDYNDVAVDVHGGLTYGSECDGAHICHVPPPGEPADLFWFGFDCLHCWDLAPGHNARLPEHLREYDKEYRSVGYARNQAMALAEQFAARQKETAVSASEAR